jgi:hypothetical protein
MAEKESHQESLIAFPCDFLIKVMGETSDTFAATMLEVISQHEPKFDASKIEIRQIYQLELHRLCGIPTTVRRDLSRTHFASFG